MSATPTGTRAWDTHERIDRLSSGIYATIVVAGVLAASEWDPDPHAFDTGLYALATVAVLWFTHAWAHWLGHRYEGGTHPGLRYSLAHDFPLVEAAIPALVALTLARALGATDEGAINFAFWVCVASLSTLGALIAWRSHAPAWRIVTAGAGCGLLGFGLVLLKELLG